MIDNIAKQMLQIWKELADINDKSTGMNYRGWEEEARIATATSALAYDPSGISTAMLVEEFYNRHLSGRHFSLSDILTPSDHIQWLLSKTEQLTNLFGAQETQEAFAGVKQSVKSALEHYDVNLDDRYEKLLANHPALAGLRVSALSSSKELQLDQFMRGEQDVTAKPVFLKSVYKWWNINSLLAAAMTMPCGVSLHLIATPKVMENYFVFVVRNGGNLYILSDIEKEAHPLQNGMRRRPDRVMSKRINKAWFPYELVDIAFTEEDDRLYETKTSCQELVAYQQEWRELSPVSELEPEVTVWLSMMFTLIIQRFWGENIQADELSYTGEMLVKSQALLDKATQANLPVAKDGTLQAVAISRESIKSAVASQEEIGSTYDLTHSWMEDRYGSKVSEEALNLTIIKDETPSLSVNTSGRVVVMDDSLEKDRTSVSVFKGLGYPSTRFAKAGQLEKDRKFIARATYADSINMLAIQEFDRRKDEIERWFKNAARNNLENLISYAGTDSIWVKNAHEGREGTVKGNRAQCRQNKKGDKFHRFMGQCQIGEAHGWYGSTVLCPEYGGKIRCNITGSQATYLVGFSPTNARELAVVAGCDISELPDVLQHWDLRRATTANSILDRVDPMAWRASDPWIEMNFIAVIALSKRGMTQVKKDIKLPPLDIATEQDMEYSSGVISVFGN